MQYGEIQIGAVILQPRPFRWPRNRWEVLELVIDDEMGWATLDSAAYNILSSYYSGAYGSSAAGLKKLLVQFVEGNVSSVVTVTDWRGNTGSFVFSPGDGLELEEIPGSSGAVGGPFYTGRIRLIRVG